MTRGNGADAVADGRLVDMTDRTEEEVAGSVRPGDVVIVDGRVARAVDTLGDKMFDAARYDWSEQKLELTVVAYRDVDEYLARERADDDRVKALVEVLAGGANYESDREADEPEQVPTDTTEISDQEAIEELGGGASMDAIDGGDEA